MNASRPVYYTGSDATAGGHAFVIDGYNEHGFVHVNWGWGPKGGNGYFDIALLNPTGYSFSDGQDMLVGVSPVKVMDAHSHVISKEKFTAYKFASMLNLSAGTMYNLAGESFTGEVAFVLMKDNTAKVLKSITASNIADSRSVGELSGMITLPAGISDGTYRLFVGSRSSQYAEDWQLVRRPSNQVNSYEVVISGGSVQSVDTGTTDDSWKTTGIRTIDTSASSADVTVFDLQGHKLMHVPAVQFSNDLLPVGGVYVVKQGEKTMKVMR